MWGDSNLQKQKEMRDSLKRILLFAHNTPRRQPGDVASLIPEGN